MANLGNPRDTIEILQKYQFAFQKRFGITPEEYCRRSQIPVQEETHVHHSVHSLERFYSREKSLDLLADARRLPR